jgi:hypothetical protein
MFEYFQCQFLQLGFPVATAECSTTSRPSDHNPTNQILTDYFFLLNLNRPIKNERPKLKTT